LRQKVDADASIDRIGFATCVAWFLAAGDATVTLLAIKQALSKELSSETAFVFINTRLILRTGVDLRQDGNAQIEPARLIRVIRELQDMGYLNGVDDE
jgi:hypothetical protein